MGRGTWVAIAVVALVIASPFVLTAPSPSGNTVDALKEERTQIAERPVAQLRNNAYEAGIG